MRLKIDPPPQLDTWGPGWRRWIFGLYARVAKLGEFVSVRSFGAAGDNATDDTAAIQAILNAIGAAGGGTLFFPAGIYLVSSGLSVMSNTRIIGEGYASVIKIKNGSSFSNNILKLEVISNSEVIDIRLDGNRANVTNTQYGIYVGGSNNCRVQGCFTHSFSGVGLHSYNSNSCKYIGNTCWDNFFHGMELEQTTNSAAVGNICRNNLRHGLYVFEGEVGASGSKGLTISGNVFHNNVQSGIIIQGPLCEGIDLTGNVMRNNAESGLIMYGGVKSVTITGNQSTGNGHFGIYIFSCAGHVISGNTVEGNSLAANGGYAEILLEGNSWHHVITGNSIKVNPSGPKASFFIKEASTSDGPNIIANNLCVGVPVNGAIGILHESGIQSSMSLAQGNFGRITRNRGRSTFNGDGVNKTFLITHSLTPDEPRGVQVTPGSFDAMTAAAAGFFVTTNNTSITVTFGIAPITSVGGVVIHWDVTT